MTSPEMTNPGGYDNRGQADHTFQDSRPTYEQLEELAKNQDYALAVIRHAIDLSIDAWADANREPEKIAAEIDAFVDGIKVARTITTQE